MPAGAYLLHDCDNPACVNPKHLKAGTQKQNIHDAMAKGRWMTEARQEYLETVAERPRGPGGQWQPD